MNQIYINNKKAHFAYNILETLETGIVLKGWEVKAIKTKKVSLKGAFITLRTGEAFLLNANISPYQPKNTPKDYNPERPRKLLLQRREINYLIGKTQQKGLTLIPLKLYNKKGKIKLQIGLAKGRQKHDKKELLKKRDIQREVERTLRDKDY
jgi:SsrA-binding protein